MDFFGTMMQGYAPGGGGDPFTPFKMTDVSGCIVWLRSDQGVTTSGANVGQWSDYSGFGNHVSQSDTNRKPLLTTSDSNFNNSASINFQSPAAQSSTSDWLVSTGSINGTGPQSGWSWVAIGAVKLYSAGNRNLMAVGDTDNVPGASLGRGWEGRNEHDQIQFGIDDDHDNNAAIIMNNDEAYGDSVPHLWVARYQKETGGALQIYQDGLEGTKQVGSVATDFDSAHIEGKFVVGNSAGLNVASSASWTEIAVYNRKLSDSEVVEIQQWVSAAYKISQSYIA